jgi:hypothetical protein
MIETGESHNELAPLNLLCGLQDPDVPTEVIPLAIMVSAGLLMGLATLYTTATSPHVAWTRDGENAYQVFEILGVKFSCMKCPLNSLRGGNSLR